MYLIQANNVNDAFYCGAQYLRGAGVVEETRAGKALVAPGPVLTVYNRPTERVLFNAQRDCNPFFHFAEALWMLAGRSDAAFLNRYVKDFGARFAEANGMIHGAYGWRWRSWFHYDGEYPIDQIEAVVKLLRDNPESRQAVIQMWDPNADLIQLDGTNTECKDRPCNTQVYLRVRGEPTACAGSWEHDHSSVLDLTVACRSNDIIWGAYGANAVHFSFLQEYLAGRIGVGVGRMYQFSNNYHAYVNVFERKAALPQVDVLYGSVPPLPIGDVWHDWDSDLDVFMLWHDRYHDVGGVSLDVPSFSNNWFTNVAVPMVKSYVCRKDPDVAGRNCRQIAAPDWRRAAGEWLQRRWKKEKSVVGDE